MLRVVRLVAIVAGGALLGLAWNAWSGRGFVLGQSVFVQAGDEVPGSTGGLSSWTPGLGTSGP